MMRLSSAVVLVAGVCASGTTLSAQRTSRTGGSAATGTGAARTTTGSATSIGVRVGTLGVGLEVSRLLGDHVGARIGGNFLTLTKDQTQDDVTFDATIKLQSVSGLLDWYPGRRGSFHVSVGAVSNPLTFAGIGLPEAGGIYTINNRDYTSSQIGTYSASAKYAGVLPYVGLGFGTPASKSRGFSVVFDIGAAIGKPTVLLSSSNAANVPGLRADIAAETASAQESVNKFPAYPVVSLGLTYRF